MPGSGNWANFNKFNTQDEGHRRTKFRIGVDLFDRVSTDSTIVEQNASLLALATKGDRAKDEHNSYDSKNL